MEKAVVPKQVFATVFATVGVLLVIAIGAASSAAAQYRKQDDGYRYREYRGYSGQRPDFPRNARRDPNSYDGVRTGQPRTCGSQYMQYDPWGVPHGPYCN
jgi:hypothetical protein